MPSHTLEERARQIALRKRAQEIAARRSSPRARLGVPEDPGSVFAQAGRGAKRSLGGTVEMVKQFGQAAHALPVVAARAAGLQGRDVASATRRGFVVGAKEVPRAIRDAPLETLAGLEEGLTPVEQGAKIATELGQAFLLKKVPGVRAIRRGRVVRRGAAADIARRQPPIGPDRQLAAAPAEVVREVEQRAAAVAAAPRVASQEAADIAGGRRFGAPVRPPEPPPGRVGGRAPRLEDELQKALEEVRRPQPPARVSAQPPRFGQRPGPEQPRVTISPAAEQRLRAEGRRVPSQQELDAPLAKVKEAAARAKVAAPAASGPKMRVSAPEVRAVSDARTSLREKAGGPLPKGMQSQIDRLRVEYNRTQMEAKRLRATKGADPREAQRFEQASRELGSRLSGMERQAVRLARAGSERGGARTGALIGAGAAGAGAVAGGTVGTDKSERIANALVGGAAGLAVVKGIRALTPARRAALGELALTARREAFLSGTALPKNVLTALGAPAIAAAEVGGAQARTLMKQYPRLMKDIGKALRKPKEMIPLEAGQQPRGPVSRRIGAVDQAAENALRRGGMSQEQIDRALVKTPLAKTVGQGVALDVLQSKPGRFALPFQRTPFDIAVGGATEVREALPRALGGGKPAGGAFGSAGRRRALTAGTAAAGAGVASSLEGDKLAPLKFGLAASLFGRRALPFALGGLAAGQSFAGRGISPTPEFAMNPREMIPTSPRDIALLRLLEQLSGQER